ncbi:MAG: outer membrane protein transport protein [Alphaproteobacteria bacterium]
MKNKVRCTGPNCAWLLATTAIVGIAAMAALGEANAAGFALKEQSAAAQGNSFAGATAGAEDVSYMFFNPAALARIDGNQVAVVLSYILPVASISNVSASVAAPVGAPITGGTAEGSVNALVPALYAAYSLSPDLKLGLAINVPFGLSTDYADGWIGRYHALETTLKTVNINPVVAYRLNETLSIAAGFQAEYAEAILSSAIDFGTLGTLLSIGGSVPTAQDGRSELTGDDWAFGFNLGVLAELSETTRIGLAYRSEIDHTLTGSVDFDTGGATGAAVAGSGVFGPFVDIGGQAGLTLPQSVSAGLHHDINEQWAVMAEVAWTGWSSLDEIRVVFDNAQPDSVTTTNWDDVWFVALGATWRPNAQWTLRGGVAYDQSPIPDATRTPRIPGADRTWISLGARYDTGGSFTLDAGYSYIMFDDSSVNLTASSFGAPDENTGRGNLAFDAEIDIHIITVQATFRF